MKLQFQFNLDFNANAGAKRYLLRNLERARANPTDPSIPEGYLAVLSKHPEGTDEDVLLQAIVGEVTAEILKNEIREYMPPEDFGVTVAVSKVQYQEAVPPLEPPEGTTAQVIHINRKAD